VFQAEIQGKCRKIPCDSSWTLSQDHHQLQAISNTNMVNTADNVAAAAYRTDFPDGHEIIPTSGEGLHCGLAAVLNTMEAMHPTLPHPTVSDLLIVFFSPEFKEMAAPFGLDNVNNFTVDQVGAVLRWWGATNNLALRLGYVVGEKAFLVPQVGEANIVWIENDGAEALFGSLGHWSGLKPKPVAVGAADQDRTSVQDSSTRLVPAVESASSEILETGAEDLDQPLWRRFAELPPLIQFMVHKNVFNVGKLFPWRHQHGEYFNPKDSSGTPYQRPNMAWMDAIVLMDKQRYEEKLTIKQLEKYPFFNYDKWASRTLKEEAERALYGGNIIITNEKYHEYFFGDEHGGTDHYPEYPPWPRNDYIRSIQVSVTDDLDRDMYNRIARRHRYKAYPAEAERFAAIHEDTADNQWEGPWFEMFDNLFSLGQLRFIEVNLDQANCYHGCCRRAVEIVTELIEFEYTPLIEEVVVSGTRDDAERAELQEIILGRLRADLPRRWHKVLVSLPAVVVLRGDWVTGWPAAEERVVEEVEDVPAAATGDEVGTKTDDAAGGEDAAGTKTEASGNVEVADSEDTDSDSGTDAE